jgi:biofilm PGA synthesis N-glycosyltransferase PgaC
MAFKCNYGIIMPVRNESAYIEKTIKCLVNQTVKPVFLIAVNDGSTDNTGEIIDRYAKQFDWIHPLHRQDRGYRKNGIGVMEAFYDGFKTVNQYSWNYICKLDGDLSFEDNFFEKALEQFDLDPKLGITGGKIVNAIGEQRFYETHPKFHVRGATKIYRRTCWETIGGLVKMTGWDTYDEIKAIMEGWKTKTIENLVILHYRPTGKADGLYKNYFKNGTGSYILGYQPLFLVLRAIKCSIAEKNVLAGIGMVWGFFTGKFRKIKRIPDRMARKFIAGQQIRLLLKMKSIWK